MARRVTKKEKKQASINKINKVFKRMKIEGHSVKGVVKNNDKKDSNNTLEQYAGDVVRYVDYLEENFGIVDITQAKNEHFMTYVEKEVRKWRNGDLAASHRVKSIRSALESFRIGSIKTDVFKKEIEIVDKKEVKKVLDYNHMRRMSLATSTISLGMGDGEKILDEISKSRSKHADVTYHAFKIAMLTGGRISDIIDKLTPNDIKINDTEVEFRDGKGGLTASVPIASDTAQYLIDLSQNKGENDPIFRLRKDNGQVMSKKNAVRTIERIVSNAGKKSGFNKEVEIGYKYRNDKGKTCFGVTKVEQKVTFHTARKIFVNSRFEKYVSMDEKALKSELNSRIADVKVRKKYHQALKRINENRKNGSRGMHQHEIAIFITSLDARHYRSDVITMWYLNKAVVETHRKAA